MSECSKQLRADATWEAGMPANRYIQAAQEIEQFEAALALMKGERDRFAAYAEQRYRDGLDKSLGAVLGELLEDPQPETSDEAYDRAVNDCAEAIRELMKVGGAPLQMSAGIEAALLEDTDRLRQKIHVMGDALKTAKRGLEWWVTEHGCCRGQEEAAVMAIDHALSYVPPETPLSTSSVSRSPADYAIEHAGYLATAATRLLEASNTCAVALEACEEAEGPEEDAATDQAYQEALSLYNERASGMREMVYEFEKRRDRALSTPEMMRAKAASVSKILYPRCPVCGLMNRCDRAHCPNRDYGAADASGVPRSGEPT